MSELIDLRVGYVVKTYPRYSETFIVNEILAHEAAGMKVEIFSLRPPQDAHFQDIISRVQAPVTYLPAETPRVNDFWELLQTAHRTPPERQCIVDDAWGAEARDVHQAALLAEVSRQNGLALLHAHFAGVSTTVARLAAHLAGIPYSFTCHAKDIYHESASLEDWQRKLGDAAAVITVSDFNVRYLREMHGRAAAGVRRVYNGLDLNRFPYQSPRERQPLLLSVGRLVEKKGLIDLIDACGILVSRGRQIQCQIVGTGPLEPTLRARICQLGLADRVRLLGPLPQADVVRLLQLAVAFVAPCVVGADQDRDGLPTVLLEAMASGTPCISTDVTGIPEAVHDGVTGLTVPQHDPLAIAEAVERLIADSTLRVQLASDARKLMQERFDVHRNSAELRAIFRQVAMSHQHLSWQAA